ncbi:MAG: sigma-70 family RNA polymerase sigma factor [Rubripirellula sp.]
MDTAESAFELNEENFLRLLVNHESALRAYARSIVPDWTLVDEAIQEASVVMWQKKEQLREESGFAPWAKVILRFKCLRQIEKLRLERPILSDAMIATLASRHEASGAEIDQEKTMAFKRCFQELSADHQRLLLAPHTPNISLAKIAEEKKRTANALYKAMGRLRKKLASCIRQRLISGSLS